MLLGNHPDRIHCFETIGGIQYEVLQTLFVVATGALLTYPCAVYQLPTIRYAGRECWRLYRVQRITALAGLPNRMSTGHRARIGLTTSTSLTGLVQPPITQSRTWRKAKSIGSNSTSRIYRRCAPRTVR